LQAGSNSIVCLSIFWSKFQTRLVETKVHVIGEPQRGREAQCESSPAQPDYMGQTSMEFQPDSLSSQPYKPVPLEHWRPSRPKALGPSGPESSFDPPLAPRGHAASRLLSVVPPKFSLPHLSSRSGKQGDRGGGRLSDSTIPWLALTRGAI
jgi:hypothetical protein